MNSKKSSTKFTLTATVSAWGAGIVSAIFLAVSGGNAFADLGRPFTPGDIVIERFGDNTIPLTNAAAAPIFIEERTPGGTLVQSIEVPTNGASALVDVANSGGDVAGGMSMSANGKSIVFPGYNANSGTPSVSSLTATNALRGIGKFDANGNYTLPVTSSNAFTGTTIRGAVSDGGTNYWATGTYPVAGTPLGGVWYFGTAPQVQVFTNGHTANLRCCGIFNGNLWFDTASSTALSYGVAQFAGLPITVAQPTNVLNLISADGSFNFSVSPNANVIYIADDGDEETTNAGIHKFILTGSTWSQAYLLVSNTPCYGLAVNWQTVPPTIYATTGTTNPNTVYPNTNALIVLQDNGANSVATTNAIAGSFEDFRGVAFAPTNATAVFQAPTITGIYPAAQTNVAGATAVITLFGDTGNPIGSNIWYQIVGTTTNVVSGQTGDTLVFPNSTAEESGGYFAVITNAYGSVTSSVSELTVTAVPTITGITPSGSISVDVDNSLTLSLTATIGNPPASNFWYHVVGSTTTLVPGATGISLTLNNTVSANDGTYFAVLSNVFGVATSPQVVLTVTNDPEIQAEPANTYGLLNGVAQFSVIAFGSAPIGYQWYFNNNGTITPVVNGNDFGDQAVVSGSANNTLTISNLQSADLPNVFVVVTNAFGSVTSSVASILGINTSGSVLAYWDFAAAPFTNTVVNPGCVSNPVPYLGVGTATAVGTCVDPGTSPFISTTTADPSGGAGEYFMGSPLPQPGFSWGVGLGALPLTNNISTNADNGNKMSGVQFNVSTVGAKNIKLNFDARATQTASEYERIQYTTNGTTWIDYPASTSFNGIAGSGAGGWETYPNEDYGDNLPYDDYPSTLQTYFDFTGFPGVANNPNFGVRIVLEYEDTATYGIDPMDNYLGVGPDAYAFGGNQGTETYDLVGFYGDAITNNNVPPVISGFSTNGVPTTNEITQDTVAITNTFTVSGDTTADKFTYSAVSLNPSTVNPNNFTFIPNADGTCTLIIQPNPISQNVAAAPILVTVTDTNGDSTAAWFILTVTTQYPSPTVTVPSLIHTLANQTVGTPFTVGSPVDPVGQFTYSTGSGNNTVIPAANVTIATSGGTATTTNPIVYIAPATNQLGAGLVSVTVNDNDTTEGKGTTVSIPVEVVPNTNVIAIDYFNYDNSGALDTVAANFWQHLSGHGGQMQVSSSSTGGFVTVDTFNNTENLQTPLVGAPYSSGTLYYSFVINMNPENMPIVNGSYFAAFNDGQDITSDVNDLLVAATNGVITTGNYRLGIADDNGSTSLGASMFPLDLVPGSNYVIVTALVLSNGTSTVWINPSSQSSPSVTAAPDANTIPYAISDFELRESGGTAGGVNVSFVKVGTTFDSVFPALHASSAGTNVIVNWSDPTLGIQSATSVMGPFTDVLSAEPPYTNNTSTNAVMYFRFGR